MNEKHVARIAEELKLRPNQVHATTALLDEGCTVPFVARYRKEATGTLDEVAIAAIRDRSAQLAELDQRRDAIVKSLAERNLLTEELKAKVDGAATLAVLEDIYLPFRPKRRTRATIAKEKGLEPLGLALFEQDPGCDPAAAAAAYVSAEKGVASVDEALAGARDVIAERVNEDVDARGGLRELFSGKGTFASQVVEGKESEGAKYRDYFKWEEPIASAPSHRILAMRRGENEGFLALRVQPPELEATTRLEARFVKPAGGAAAEQVRLAVRDAYKRLLAPSLEVEIRVTTKERADAEAIRIFAENVRRLLLAPPLGAKNVLALDPGFRTGCKLVCLDQQGKMLHHDVIYPHPPESRTADAARKLADLCAKLGVEMIAIGNGTAGRETETFLRGLDLPGKPPIVLVNESGASIYSASEVAREEFPNEDLTVRGSVSIGRRLQDPLAELVKLDPKSIGVGQYQHDVDAGALSRALDDVVASCVNAVGVEANTASKQLLTYVSGLGPQLAGNIVKHRDEHGPFKSRRELLEVSRLGPKAFEQAAGFLRVRGGTDPLDASAVHPESYPIVEAMARDLGCAVGDLLRDEALRARIDLKRYVTETVGLPTLQDILAELAKPGRDPRDTFEPVRFADGIEKLSDLKPGMKLEGVVTNVTAFGAFVDVGVHQDGLVHVSQLADRFVKDPNEAAKVQQRVRVTVLSVDLERKRISLSMKTNPQVPGAVADGSGAAKGAAAAGAAAGAAGAAAPAAARGAGAVGAPRPTRPSPAHATPAAGAAAGAPGGGRRVVPAAGAPNRPRPAPVQDTSRAASRPEVVPGWLADLAAANEKALARGATKSGGKEPAQPKRG
ncbi:MAG: RNA-binding transcriptional accessory protein [Planctomycetes bacterium]|nr:RNA-binding transcriptional accessory protein [Planctomycetota bacterium]